MEAANENQLKEIREKVEAMLIPVIGKDPWKQSWIVLDFTPFCVHQEEVGAIGIDWELTKACENYEALLESGCYSNSELLRLGAGRLAKEVMDCLQETGHRITFFAAHDSMMTAFLIALDIYKKQWPLYASMVLIETAYIKTETLLVRVLMNDDVCIDWQPLEVLQDRVKAVLISAADYALICEQS